jgi:tetratricopeptide (TPR) repeat protein
MESNANKLLLAIAFYDIPERKEFIQRLFLELKGDKFSETLHLLYNRKGLVQYLSEVQRYTMHDVLREFYYQHIVDKIRLHSCCATWYQERTQSRDDLIDYLVGAHHFCEAGDHQGAAALLQPVTEYCATHRYYWRQLHYILKRIDLNKISDEKLIFDTSFNLGNLRVYMKKWELALQSFSVCLQIKSQQNLYDDVFNSIGVVYMEKGEWDKAIEFFKKSLAGNEKKGNRYGMAWTFNNLGLLYKDKGELNKAIEFFQKDLEISEQVNDIYGVAKTYANLGDACRL